MHWTLEFRDEITEPKQQLSRKQLYIIQLWIKLLENRGGNSKNKNISKMYKEALALIKCIDFSKSKSTKILLGT